MDKHWLGPPADVRAYLESLAPPEPDILARLRQETARFPHAIMQIPPEQGALLAFLVKLTGAERILELGTYTGYSALAMALVLPEEGVLVTCDINEDWTAIGQHYWAEAGVAGKIDLRLGEAIETLDALGGEGVSFDLAFIDADKANYDAYYEAVLNLLRPGGLMAVDNLLLFGAVVDSKRIDRKILGGISEAELETVRRFNRKLAEDPRVDLHVLPLADGIALAQKKEDSTARRGGESAQLPG